MTLTHEQKMEKAWKAIADLNITEDEEKYLTDINTFYLVKDIHQVRDAFYTDFEAEEQPEDEDLPMFFNRHGIEWK